jgi:stage III sporulation protein SpoIIIAA
VLEDVLRSVCHVSRGGGLLLIGPPGSGKTTLLRDIAGMLDNEMNKEVVVVDTRCGP